MDLSTVKFIFCDNPLYHSKPDEDYREEFEEAHKVHPCALFSYEELQAGRLKMACGRGCAKGVCSAEKNRHSSCKWDAFVGRVSPFRPAGRGYFGGSVLGTRSGIIFEF